MIGCIYETPSGDTLKVLGPGYAPGFFRFVNSRGNEGECQVEVVARIEGYRVVNPTAWERLEEDDPFEGASS